MNNKHPLLSPLACQATGLGFNTKEKLYLCAMKKQLLLALTFFTLSFATVSAQCVMCTKTASELDNSSAQGLNGGILYLAALPLLIMGTIGYIWWKHNRNISGQ